MAAAQARQEGQAHTFGAAVQPAAASADAAKSQLAPAFLGQFYEIVGVIGEVRQGRRSLRTVPAERCRRLVPPAAVASSPLNSFCSPATRRPLCLQGTFGRVFLASSRAQPGRRLAVKYIKPGKVGCVGYAARAFRGWALFAGPWAWIFGREGCYMPAVEVRRPGGSFKSQLRPLTTAAAPGMAPPLRSEQCGAHSSPAHPAARLLPPERRSRRAYVQPRCAK